MTESGAEKRVVIDPDPQALATSVASRLFNVVEKANAAGDVVHIALTGGTMGEAVLRAAAVDPRAARADWSAVHFWWGDERWVERASDERNETVARSAFLDALPIPAENIHAFAASDGTLDLDSAAVAYADELAQFGTAVDKPWPTFDICFLGVSPDGHIASLFPDRPEISVTDRSVVPVRNSPKPPPVRLSLTRPVINSSTRVWMVLTGTDKASALGLALAGASYQSVPVAGAKGRKRTIFFVDEAAASQVPPQLIDRDY